MEPLNVAAIQCKIDPDPEKNKKKLTDLIRQSAEGGAKLIVLPELHNRPYFCQCQNPDFFDWAEPIPGPSTQWLSALAKETQTIIVGSLFEQRGPLFHNTAVVIDQDGSLAGCYRKMHIPHDPGYCEKYYFAPGEQGFNPIHTSIGKIGVLVCWDQWFPEAARLSALAGADILVYPTAIGWDITEPEDEHQAQLHAWRVVQQGHAVANSLPVISVNRIGLEKHGTGGQRFWGNSFIANQQGELISCANEKAAILLAEIDLKKTKTIRRAWPFFRDRRVSHYGPLSRLSDEEHGHPKQ